MFDFLFGKNKALEGNVENYARVSKEIEVLTQELDVLRADLEKMKSSIIEAQMSVALVLAATQGVADDLALLYSSVFGSEQSKISAFAFPIAEIDDDDYEN